MAALDSLLRRIMTEQYQSFDQPKFQKASASETPQRHSDNPQGKLASRFRRYVCHVRGSIFEEMILLRGVFVICHLDPHDHDTVRYNTTLSHDCVARGEAPMLASIFLVDVLTAAHNSELDYLNSIMAAAEEWMAEADAVIVCSDVGRSSWMSARVEAARWFGVPVEFAHLPDVAPARYFNGAAVEAHT